MTDWAASMDIEKLLRHAHELWERGRKAARSGRFEAYVKHARRRRYGRDRASTIESGAAFRWVDGDGRSLSHAAMGGTDPSRVESAIGDAHPELVDDPRVLPPTAMSFSAMRLDLESRSLHVDDATLEALVAPAGAADAVEVGVTVEVLVGAEGWTTVRSRARSVAWRDQGHGLAAGRGVSGVDLPEAAGYRAVSAHGPWELTPTAAGPLVAALVQVSPIGAEVGAAWSVLDDPRAPEGLAGGDFDDVGFPTSRRDLARDRRVVGAIDGPGMYWRRSFRDPPRALPSNLVVGSTPVTPRPATHRVDSCRVLPLGADVWVLELTSTHPNYVRTDPESLIRGCVATTGEAVVTADGAITPTLVFDLQR